MKINRPPVKKPKKSLKYSPRNIFLGISTSIAVGSLGLLGIDPKDDESSKHPQIAFQDGNSADQEPPAPETPTAGAVVGGTNQGNCLSKQAANDSGEGGGEPSKGSGGSDWVGTARGVGGILFDVAGEASAAFTPLKAALGALTVIYTNHKETTAVKDKIKAILSRIATLEAIFAVPAGDVAGEKRRSELLRKLGDIEGRLQSLYEKSRLRRFADHVQDDEDVSGLLEDMKEAISKFQLLQQMSIYEQGCNIMSAAEASVLFSFYSAQKAEYRHMRPDGCLNGTRGAVLDEIELWTKDFTKPPVFWLNGLAGTGKSTIAKTVAEQAFANGQLGASFFCSRLSEDRSDPRSIFPTIAVQLARNYAKFRSIFVPLVEPDPEIAHETLVEQMDKLIVQPLKEADISTVIIIDALDECKDEEYASRILSVIGKFRPQIPKVKFFITSRPEPCIQEGFDLPSLVEETYVFFLHEVRRDQVDNDIRLFFEHKFSELRGRRSGLDDWPTGEQLDLLCARAAGLFTNAVEAINFIEKRYCNARKQLDLLLQSPESSVHQGQTKPKANTTLDSLYDDPSG